MRAVGPSTIKEMASGLSRAPASLSAHVERLVALGVVVEREPRRLARHTERVFALIASDILPDFRNAGDKAVGESDANTHDTHRRD